MRAALLLAVIATVSSALLGRALPWPHRTASPKLPHAPRFASQMMAAVDEANDKSVPNIVQAGAIRTSSDAVLLVAPPGTGKTRVIRARIAYLHGNRVPLSSILVVTYTEHAAQQLRVRVQARAGDEAGNLWSGTFHSICERMLRAHAALLPHFLLRHPLAQAARAALEAPRALVYPGGALVCAASSTGALTVSRLEALAVLRCSECAPVQ